MIGAHFKELRLNKHLSIGQVAAGTLSKSFISRFENDLSDISFSNLVVLLNRINVSLPEFIYRQPLASESYLALEKESAFYYEHAELKELAKLEFEQYQLATLTSNSAYRANSIMLKAMQFEFTHTGLSADDTDFMNHFLFSIGTWGEYEFTLFNYSVMALPVEQSMNWALTLLKKYTPYSNKDAFPNEHVFLFGIIINLLIRCIDAHKINEAHLLSNALEKFNLPETRYQLRVSFEYLKGLIMYLDGDKLNGENHARQAISIMEYLGVATDLENHRTHLADFLKAN